MYMYIYILFPIKRDKYLTDNYTTVMWSNINSIPTIYIVYKVRGKKFFSYNIIIMFLSGKK